MREAERAVADGQCFDLNRAVAPIDRDRVLVTRIGVNGSDISSGQFAIIHQNFVDPAIERIEGTASSDQRSDSERGGSGVHRHVGRTVKRDRCWHRLAVDIDGHPTDALRWIVSDCDVMPLGVRHDCRCRYASSIIVGAIEKCESDTPVRIDAQVVLLISGSR